jgi:outer membrane protein assembly factor BamB
LNEPTLQKPLRLWPGVVIVLLQWLGRFVVPVVEPDAMFFGVIGGLLGGPAIVVWWVFFSRAPRTERWGAVVLVAVALFATPYILHESVAAGNMGFQFFLYAIPVLSLAFVVWAAASRGLTDRARRATMVATILLACGIFALARSDGLTGDGRAEFVWRWTETSEARLLARAPETMPDVVSAVEIGRSGAEWPGFRGPHRDGIIPGVEIETDWSSSPPVELWRRPIGPGISSFAVAGELLYTHEQRGEDEIVACYKVTIGEPVWRHADAARFWDSHVGAGPRATPAVSGGRVYTFGATGILNALDAGDGSVVWSRNAASDTDAELPTFGFVSSPLVVDDVVIVYPGALVAYDLATGEPRWFGPPSGESYSSPHLLTIDGVAQILLLSPAGVNSFALADGTPLWEHSWPGIGILQPALTADGDLLFSMISEAAVPIGTRRIAVARAAGGWSIEERWTTIRLKPSFSGFVVHEGYAFGFDGRILACIDVENGKRMWKGGRYGQGQLLLLPDQDLLLVVTEDGELTLVRATRERFTELARFPAIEGKTWNPPVLIDDLLLVRNGREMAAFRLSFPAS